MPMAIELLRDVTFDHRATIAHLIVRWTGGVDAMPLSAARCACLQRRRTEWAIAMAVAVVVYARDTGNK